MTEDHQSQKHTRVKVPIEVRFWAKVDKTPGLGPNGTCWEWRGSRLPFGYGTFKVNGVVKKAHRVAYELENGEIPEGVIVRHDCDHPPCCRPIHLLGGSHQDNSDDQVRRGRAKGPRGERAPSAKISQEDVISIRADDRTQRAIALDFNITPGAVSAIKTGRNWGWVSS